MVEKGEQPAFFKNGVIKGNNSQNTKNSKLFNDSDDYCN